MTLTGRVLGSMLLVRHQPGAWFGAAPLMAAASWSAAAAAGWSAAGWGRTGISFSGTSPPSRSRFWLLCLRRKNTASTPWPTSPPHMPHIPRTSVRRRSGTRAPGFPRKTQMSSIGGKGESPGGAWGNAGGGAEAAGHEVGDRAAEGVGPGPDAVAGRQPGTSMRAELVMVGVVLMLVLLVMVLCWCCCWCKRVWRSSGCYRGSGGRRGRARPSRVDHQKCRRHGRGRGRARGWARPRGCPGRANILLHCGGCGGGGC